MKNAEKIVSFIVTITLLFATLPATDTTASPVITYEADDAVLLMLASHSLLSGDGLASGNPKTASVQPQANANEIDILTDLYRQQIVELNQLGYGDDVKARLLEELEKKVQTLNAKSQRLEFERRNWRRGGFFRRFFRAVGRATGWVVSKAMEGTAKIVQYSIEEVAPKMIKDAVFNGAPLTGAAFRAVFKDMLRQRVRAILDRKLEARMGAIASEFASPPSQVQPDSEPISPPSQLQPDSELPQQVEPAADELKLTPEEELNQGTHSYTIVGTTTLSSVGNDGNFWSKYHPSGIYRRWGLLHV